MNGIEDLEKKALIWHSIETPPPEPGRYDVIARSGQRFTDCIYEMNGHFEMEWWTRDGGKFARIHFPKYWMHIPASPEEQWGK